MMIGAEKLVSINENLNKFTSFLNARKGILIVILSVVFFNAFVYYGTTRRVIPDWQRSRYATGFNMPKAEQFEYFRYYTGHFPIASLNQNLEYSKEGAKSEIENRGEDLVMEVAHWARYGESARIWACIPYALVSQSASDPSIRLFGSIVFVLSTLILYLGLLKLKKTLFGFVLLVMINITPFYLYEIYTNENIFYLVGSVFFMVLGMNIHILFPNRGNYKWSLTLVMIFLSSCIIGFFSEFRNEVSVLMGSLVLIILFAKNVNILARLGLLLLIMLGFSGTKTLIRGHFKEKKANAEAVVTLAKGHVFNGGETSGHTLWHSIFCGLGDFDDKYGYDWDDETKAYAYSVPKLKEKCGVDYDYTPGGYFFNAYSDEDSIYYIKFEEIACYQDILKEKVVNDVSSDPLWYGKILLNRLVRILTVTIPLPYLGWLVLLLPYFYWKKDNLLLLNLILISLPLCATSLIIFSLKGSTYNGVYVYFIILFILVKIRQYMIKV
jgi:hypothetical protein